MKTGWGGDTLNKIVINVREHFFVYHSLSCSGIVAYYRCYSCISLKLTQCRCFIVYSEISAGLCKWAVHLKVLLDTLKRILLCE